MWSCWALIGVLWITLARMSAPGVPAREPASDTFSRLAAALAIAAALSPASLWRPFTTFAPLPRAAGVACLLAATGFTVWARLELGRMWSSSARTRASHRLITSGPYALTRHPIYTGMIGMLAAASVDEGFGRWIVIALGVSLLLCAKARQEERLLMQLFPCEYADYRSRVPALLPRLGARRSVTARAG
jgi:protein-S-isoprenylcysteine O-methyltransferase Ste14